jgi:DNA-binding transcriptional LysR family regulator
MAQNISWELYRSFRGVIEQGSLSGAARALDIAQPTVGRHIAALERSLGLVLFTRSQSGLLPTEAAQSLRIFADSMQSAAAAMERAAASEGTGVRGTVRVTCSEIIGVEVLPPIVTALRNEYPDLTVEIVLTNQVQDLLRRQADIAVRMACPKQGQLIARRIGQLKLAMYAHRHYLDRRGTPGNITDLSAHSLIGFDTATEFLRKAGKGLTLWRREAFALRTDNDLAQLALLRAGAGIGICQTAIARRDKSLVRILPKFSLPLETWITMHQDLRHSPRCKVTFDALVDGLRRHLEAT